MPKSMTIEEASDIIESLIKHYSNVLSTIPVRDVRRKNLLSERKALHIAQAAINGNIPITALPSEHNPDLLLCPICEQAICYSAEVVEAVYGDDWTIYCSGCGQKIKLKE